MWLHFLGGSWLLLSIIRGCHTVIMPTQLVHMFLDMCEDLAHGFCLGAAHGVLDPVVQIAAHAVDDFD